MYNKILVTGGAGFVGSHLIESLRCKYPTAHIASLDNYFTGSRFNHVEGVSYISGETKEIDKLVDFSPDIIFHLGEYSRVEQSLEELDLVFNLNIIGTHRVFEFARKHSSKVIYSGSSTKFGDGGDTKNSSPYAWTKSQNTEYLMNLSRWYGLEYAITYFYNVYAGREINDGKYATLIGIYTKRMKDGLPLPVVLPGTQRRNFTHIDDIVSGLILVAEKGSGDGYGLGVDESYSVLEVASMFGGEIERLPERAGNRKQAEVISNKSIQIGWKPTRNLQNHIENLKKSNWQ